MKSILIEEYGFSQTDDFFEDNPVYVDKSGNKLITSKIDMIQCSHLDDTFDPEVYIFCSRHRAQSGKPALLVHSTGNFGEDASFGGDPFKLSISAPSLVRKALQSLYKERESQGLEEFDVTLEVTHHGPTQLKHPMIFIELGSNEKYWNHKEGAWVVTKAIHECLNTPIEGPSVIGFGGTHYASKFNKLVLERDICVGHIAPKYALDNIHPSVVEQMVQRSSSSVEYAVIDWKGTNAAQKEQLFPILESMGLEIVKARDV
jgi:D-aminoacyl-tRNA deacylase